jgi:hypothetical protein
MKRPKGAPKKLWRGQEMAPLPERHVCPVCRCEMAGGVEQRIRAALMNVASLARQVRQCKEELLTARGQSTA